MLLRPPWNEKIFDAEIVLHHSKWFTSSKKEFTNISVIKCNHTARRIPKSTHMLWHVKSRKLFVYANIARVGYSESGPISHSPETLNVNYLFTVTTDTEPTVFDVMNTSHDNILDKTMMYKGRRNDRPVLNFSTVFPADLASCGLEVSSRHWPLRDIIIYVRRRLRMFL